MPCTRLSGVLNFIIKELYLYCCNRSLHATILLETVINFFYVLWFQSIWYQSGPSKANNEDAPRTLRSSRRKCEGLCKRVNHWTLSVDWKRCCQKPSFRQDAGYYGTYCFSEFFSCPHQFCVHILIFNESMMLVPSLMICNCEHAQNVTHFLLGRFLWQKKELELEVDNVVAGAKPTRKIRWSSGMCCVFALFVVWSSYASDDVFRCLDCRV